MSLYDPNKSHPPRYWSRVLLLLLLLSFQSSMAVSSSSEQQPRKHYQLDGFHLRFTLVHDDGWVNIVDAQDPENSDHPWEFSGYAVDIIRHVARLANFTYSLYPPSGFGSLCNPPRQVGEDTTTTTTKETNNNSSLVLLAKKQQQTTQQPYETIYRNQYLCGQSDVQEYYQEEEYTTDFYQGMFYMTPERQLLNRFTVPFVPPTQGGLQLFGTAVRIRDIDDLIQQQAKGLQGPVCLRANSAYARWVHETLPQLHTIDADFGAGTEDDYYRLLSTSSSSSNNNNQKQNLRCPIIMAPNPLATRTVLLLSQKKLCTVHGMPIGLIGPALSYGYSQFAMGVQMEVAPKVGDAINYWMNYLMTCSPTKNENCTSFGLLYPQVGGTGGECGYNPFPPLDETHAQSAAVVISGMVLSACLVLCLLLASMYVYRKYQKRRHRVKKRLVQQIARNIKNVQSPDEITTQKMSQLVHHISRFGQPTTTEEGGGGGKTTVFTERDDIVTERDIRNWMTDIHLPFLSESDLVYLWALLDTKKNGYINGMDFIVFLRTCQREFKQVSDEMKNMSKTELMKFTCRSLSDQELLGEEGVRKKEFEFLRRSRLNSHIQS